jgi:hypothetical protein
MAKVHRATLQLKNFDLPKAGSAIQIDLFNGKGKIGKFTAGRGGAFWKPGRKQKEIWISWTKLADMLNEQYECEKC